MELKNCSTSPSCQNCMMMNSYVDQLVASIDSTLGPNGRITSLNLLSICINCMRLVESFPELKGIQKKDLVIKAITKMDSDSVIINMLPEMIDTVINLEKGTITVSQAVAETAVGCCLGFCQQPKTLVKPIKPISKPVKPISKPVKPTPKNC